MSIASLITRGIGPDSSIAAAVLRGFTPNPVSGSLLPLRGFGTNSTIAGILLRGFSTSAAPTQQQVVCTGTSWTGDSLQESVSPAVEAGDIFYADFFTTPGNYPVTVNGDGTVVVDAQGDKNRQYFMANIYDTSASALYGAFRVYINNGVPQVVNPVSNIRVLVNNPIFPVDFTPPDPTAKRFIADPNSDPISSSVQSGALQAGLTLSNNVLSGQPTASGDQMPVLRFVDPVGDYVDVPLAISVDPGAIMPSVIGSSLAAAQATIIGAGFSVFSQVDQQPDSATAGTVIAQSPAAGLRVFTDAQSTLTIASALPVIGGGPTGSFAAEDGPVEYYPIELAEQLRWLKNYATLRADAITEAATNGLWARRATVNNKLLIAIAQVPGHPKPVIP